MYWQFRYGWHWPAPLALVAVLGVFGPAAGRASSTSASCGACATPPTSPRSSSPSRSCSACCRSRPVDLEPGRAPHRRALLRQRRGARSSASSVTDHEADRPRPRRRHRRGPPPASSPAPAPAWPCAASSTTRRCCSSTGTTRAAGRVLLGPGGVPGRAGRHPHHADQRRHPRRQRADPARASTPSPPPCSAGCAACRCTFVGALVLGLASTYVLAYFPKSWSWASTSAIALPMIVLFVVLIVLPQDRLRGATVRRTRERFQRADRALRPSRRGGARRGGRPAPPDDGRPDITSLTVGITFAHHRPVAHPADRVRRRDQPGPGLLRRHRHHHRVPPRPPGSWTAPNG